MRVAPQRRVRTQKQSSAENETQEKQPHSRPTASECNIDAAKPTFLHSTSFLPCRDGANPIKRVLVVTL